MLHKIFLIFGSIFAFIGVSLGAFGAHFLKQRLDSDMLNIFEVGVRYQMYHALALIAVALIANSMSNSYIMAAGWSFIAGMIVFSGSLYVLSLSGVRAWGAVTPLGGLLFLLGWVLLAWGVLKS